MDILRVEHVTLGYEKNPVIRDISFGVPDGSVYGIIGPNGAGKTTLFKTLSRIRKPWQGTVSYKGSDIGGMSRREFARMVAVIPQFRSVPPPFTVQEFVSMGRYPHGGRLSRLDGEDRKIIEEAMERLNVGGFRHKLVSSLSGGEMQRVFLAQGLAQRPELILMDEPTAHLDIGQKIRTLDLLRSLSKGGGLTALVILHDLNLAGMYCDYIVMMAQGGIHASGKPEEVLTGKHISEVYGTLARVERDPATSRPHIYFLPQN
jgi:ABC-type cobalamin/Fe3+-siderophores transport system ATPase subunit